MVPDVHGLVAPEPRVVGFDGSAIHLSQHCDPHHGSEHATHTLQPRVFAQRLQHSAGEDETVAPGPEPGTITAPSNSVCILAAAHTSAAASIVAVVVSSEGGDGGGGGGGSGGGGGGGGSGGGGGGGSRGGGGGGGGGETERCSAKMYPPMYAFQQ